MVRLPKMPKSSIAQDIAYDAMEYIVIMKKLLSCVRKH